MNYTCIYISDLDSFGYKTFWMVHLGSCQIFIPKGLQLSGLKIAQNHHILTNLYNINCTFMKRTDLLSVKTFEIDPNYEPN